MGTQSLLEKKVGQLLFVGVRGKSLEAHTQKILSRVGPGGVILFKDNYESVDQLVSLTNEIQKIATFDAFKGWPSFIGVDQEGGRVKRLGEPFSQFPPAAKVGATGSPKTAFEVGFVMGKELRACGVNLNFAPIADVPDTLDSGIIGDRAYSTDPETVGQMASGVARGLQKAGVVAVAKHFPGHGCVTVDSHLDLPFSQKTVEELEAKEWISFKRIVRAKVEGLMTAHILFPKIDPDRPATLSRRFVQDQIRKNLRFGKLVFSDDLEMGALAKKYSLAESAFLAIEAGCDQVLICHEYGQIEVVWEQLVKAFDSGALPIEKLDEALLRIEESKRRFLIPHSFAVPDLARAIVGAPQFLSVAASVSRGEAIESGPSSAEE